MHYTAKMTVELEIKAKSNWDRSCPLEQVFKQASTEAEQVVRSMMRMYESYGGAAAKVRMVPTRPRVTAVLVPEE